MFLRKETKTIKTGTYKMVQFCDDCGSEDIRVVCNKCGSHNIKHPSFDDMISDDKRGMHEVTKEKEVYMYKCDKCGKEFDGTDTTSAISNVCGEFEVGTYDDEYGDTIVYRFDKDLCYDCLKKIVEKLNKELEDINTAEHVNEVFINI